MPITRRMALLLATACPAYRSIAAEVPPLSPAQIALFETPHLASIKQPTRLSYAFRREEAGRAPVDDRIVLEVRRVSDDGRHDVHAEFLTGDRRINYPPALGFKGNPLLLFALDRESRELASATGGSMNWFRGRFRRALVDEAETLQEQVKLAALPHAVAAQRIIVMPYGGEPRARRFQGLRYDFVLSGAVPGGILQMLTTVPAAEDGPAMAESITYSGSEAL
ncbi:hypothetical protein [Teichococcus oryzae]|uniref:Uncharacterized protein n=1 Tax=Teichococcus oryzae TaxID=1608942 RepID=A0A5B2TH28_9PROT|nr:hypothetical protein [Pseudoroseomonas oryzae]KAA2213509.1 hypothetical protein F0Q34_09755 [Pseudoroseomonas oryzae]